MSENERLREALRDMIELSMEDNSMWELHETDFRERRRAARNALAAEPEVFGDRLNALERDNADLNAELTETIAAVSDLMDENERLRTDAAQLFIEEAHLIGGTFEARLHKMREAIEKLRVHGHYECEDCWYSCPKSDGYCREGDVYMECTCGADEQNAIIDAAIADSLRQPKKEPTDE